MIIYKCIVSGDEILSDTYPLKEVADGALWETDVRQYTKGSDNFELAGANPSAEEGGDDFGGDEAGGQQVFDIEESFQLVRVPPEGKPSKDLFKSELKKYIKAALGAMKEKGVSEEKQKAFQKSAATGMKKIIANYDNYDILKSESQPTEAEGMVVLIDYREDGVTPYATIWQHCLEEIKV